MNGEQPGLRVRRTAPQELPALSLGIRRVLDGVPRYPVWAEFEFDPDVPMIVSVTFTPWRGASVTWRISRELLYRGLYEESGEGDVQAWPTHGEDGEAVWLLIESKDASAVFELPAGQLEAWLDASYDLVSPEAESDVLDWESFIAELLDKGELPSG